MTHGATQSLAVSGCHRHRHRLGPTGSAEAASYYTITNTASGLALQTDPSGEVRLATPNRFSLGQQFKLIETEGGSLGSVGGFNAAIQNRLGACLVDSSPLTFEKYWLDSLRTGSCNGASKSRRMWAHLSGSLTATPSISGYQMVNWQTAGYVTDFCLFDCNLTHNATVLSESFIGDNPTEWSGAAKWKYRFAVSATP